MLIKVADYLARAIFLHAFYPHRYRVFHPAQLLVRTRAQINNKLVYSLESLCNLLAPVRFHGAAAKFCPARKPVMRDGIAGAEDAKKGVANGKAIPCGEGRSVQGIKEHAGLSPVGAVMASDAFFPFRDGIDNAAAVGIKAIIQPGGSMRDDETIAAADEHGIAMVFTGMRHFRH